MSSIIPLNTTQTTKTLNTTFVDQQTAKSVDANFRGSYISNSLASMESMTDPHLSVNDLFTKPLYSSAGLITSASTNIFTLQLPDIFYANDDTINYQMLSTFIYYRSAFKVKVQINSPPMNAGLFYLSFRPVNSNFATAVDYYAQNTGFPGVFISAYDPDISEITIPFNTILNYFNTLEPDTVQTLGTVSLDVISNLATGTGSSSSIPFQVWITAESPHFAVPVPFHNIPTNPYETVTTVEAQSSNESLFATASSVVDDVRSASESLASGKISGAVTSGAHAISSVLSTLGMDFPETGSFDSSKLAASFPSISKGKGIAEFEVLSLNPLVTKVQDDETLATTTDE
jgi:hypothetical protein